MKGAEMISKPGEAFMFILVMWLQVMACNLSASGISNTSGSGTHPDWAICRNWIAGGGLLRPTGMAGSRAEEPGGPAQQVRICWAAFQSVPASDSTLCLILPHTPLWLLSGRYV